MTNIAERIAALPPEKRSLLLRQLVQEEVTKQKPQPIEHQSREINRFPLSFSQQRLWFLEQLESGQAVYNNPFAVRLRGTLNISAMEQSIAEILRRHEVLRTTFEMADGQAVQIIHPEPAFSLPLTDLSHMEAEVREVEMKKLVSQEAYQAFDLTKDFPLRAKLLRLEEQEHVFLITLHHIASDGWSFTLFTRELTSLYRAFNQGQASSLDPLPIQYADYALWQREWLESETQVKQMTYWKEQLGGELPVLRLPTDYPRPMMQTFREGREIRSLSAKLSQDLKRLCQQEGTTLFMTLLAAFKLLLQRYSGQDDIIIGSPIAGRNRVEIERLIGFFINSLVLRSNLAGEPTFRELLGQVKEMTLSAFANQDIPFEKLLEELKPERDTSRTPIFQVFFNMLNLDALASVPQLDGLEAEPFPFPEVGAKFDLTLYVIETDEQISFRLVYNADLFKAERIAEMLTQYEALLGQIVANPHQKISQYSLITDKARAYLPDLKHPLEARWQNGVHQQFSQMARKHPKQVALVDQTESWLYEDLERRSNQLAQYLLTQGLQKQEIVAIYGHRSVALIWALLGILKAGGAFLILDPAYPAERLVKYVEGATPQAWLQVEAAGQLPDELAKIVSDLPANNCLTLPQTGVEADSLLADYSTTDPQLKIEPEDLAYIAFTSGSTGKPKGILGSHQPLAHFVQWHSQRFELNETDRFSMLGGLAHDPLLRDIFTPLCLGATLCIPTQEDILMPGQLAGWMAQQKISICHLTPAVNQLLTQTAVERTQNNGRPINLNDLRYAFFGGDVLTNQHVQALKELAPTVECVNFYGTTETPQAMAYLVTSTEQNGDGNSRARTEYKIPIGQGIEGVQLLVLNQAQQLAGIGEVGEICVRTPYLARGYLGEEAFAQERFIINPFTKTRGDRIYKTGDLGRYLPDGKVEYLGRNDNQVKIRGFRIELGEIEAVLEQYPGVREAVVSTWTTETGDKQLAAYVMPTTPSLPPTAGVLREFLQEKIPQYMVPSVFIPLEKFPLTPNGKLDRRALPLPDQSQLTAETEFVAASNKIEEQLTTIWQELLHVSSIGVHDDFFALGGHSLMAIRLMAQIKTIFDVNLPLATLMQKSTIASLAKIIETETIENRYISLVPIQPQGNRTPFFCVHGIGGHVMRFQKLAHHLGLLGQPLYGLQAQGVDGDLEPYQSIEAMATHYIREIQTIQPQGPYFLGGLSMGGWIIYEMARQLQLQGQDVGLVAVFDTRADKLPRFFEALSSFQMWQYLRRRYVSRLQYHYAKLSPLSWSAKVRYPLHFASQKFFKDTRRQQNPVMNAPIPEELRAVWQANILAVRSYIPISYPGKLTLFRSTEVGEGSYYGWEEWAQGGVDVLDIPGTHIGILDEPNVQILAKKLTACIDTILLENERTTYFPASGNCSKEN